MHRPQLVEYETDKTTVGPHSEDEECSETREDWKILQHPQRLTEIEVQEHALTRLPFRSWCDHFVRGRGESPPHARTHRDADLTLEMQWSCFAKLLRQGSANGGGSTGWYSRKEREIRL